MIFKEGGVLGGSKKTSVAGDSHSNVKSKKAKGAGGDNSNADQSSTHVKKAAFFSLYSGFDLNYFFRIAVNTATTTRSDCAQTQHLN